MVKLKSKVAFVTGCNGISGNAIVEHLIRTPKTEWSKIIITSRRPLAAYVSHDVVYLSWLSTVN